MSARPALDSRSTRLVRDVLEALAPYRDNIDTHDRLATVTIVVKFDPGASGAREVFVSLQDVFRPQGAGRRTPKRELRAVATG